MASESTQIAEFAQKVRSTPRNHPCLRITVSLQVRTQTLVKNAIVVVDATPFKQHYQQHYGVELGTKKKIAAGLLDVEAKEKEEAQSHSKHVNRKHQQRAKGHKIDTLVRLSPGFGIEGGGEGRGGGSGESIFRYSGTIRCASVLTAALHWNRRLGAFEF